MKRIVLLFILFSLCSTSLAPGQNLIKLTLRKAVDIAMGSSYRTKFLEMEIKRNIYRLRARQASLHTQVYMNLKSPNIENIMEHKWNSDLRREEIVRVNTQLWQSDLSIRQPVILFGYPTNGSLSLNHKIYHFQQQDDGNNSRDLYNRFYLKFEQPFFLPNELKYDLEEARLNLKENKIRYISERAEIIEDISDDYFDIFENVYDKNTYQEQLTLLRRIAGIADSLAQIDESRSIEMTQIDLEISNARENILSKKSDLRHQFSELKQRLRLNFEDSLYVVPDINLYPVQVDKERALEMAYSNSTWLRRLNIWQRRSEIDVANVKGRNAFHLSLEMTYGLEKKNHELQGLIGRYENSNSITLNAHVPVWDGGVRKNNIQAEMVDVRRQQLRIDREREDIRKDITNGLSNAKEYYNRSKNMQQSMKISRDITRQSMRKYAQQAISLQDLLQVVENDIETRFKFINVYMDYRFALLNLKLQTLFDFRKNIPLADEFKLEYKK